MTQGNNRPENVGLPPEGTGRVKRLHLGRKRGWEDPNVAQTAQDTQKPGKAVRSRPSAQIQALVAAGLIASGGLTLATGMGLWLGFPFALVTIGVLMVLVGIMVGRD